MMGSSFVLIKTQSRRRGSCSSLISSSLPEAAPCSRLSPWGTTRGSQLSLRGDGGCHCATPRPEAAAHSAPSQPEAMGFHMSQPRALPQPFIPWAALGVGWICSFYTLFLKQGSPGEMGLLLLCVSKGCCWGKGGDVGLGGGLT